MKKLLFVVFIGCLALARQAGAQFMTGSVFADNNTSLNLGAATSSSMQLALTNFDQEGTGSFAGIITSNSILQAIPSHNISGLSSTPISVSINNYIEFSQTSFFHGLTGTGTTPPNRFDFDLLTLAEDSFDSGTGGATFSGTGTIVDTTGTFQNTSAILTVDFFNADSYQLQIEAVPEPATISLTVAGLAGLWALRRRKDAKI